MSDLVIVTGGIASTIQDQGRPGHAHLGVPASGAVDRALAALVNRLVGNPPDAAVIETCGGIVLRAGRPLLLASSRELAPTSLATGARFTLPVDPDRLWHYIAVRGGIAVPVVLGSRSTDTLSGLGPAPLGDGRQLSIGDDPATPITTDHAPLRADATRARITVGPRADWFEPDAIGILTGADWTVTATNRIGARLAGPVIERVERSELPSEGLVRGAIQIPPDGNPVMMLADHPTTGGYPVLAVVHHDDVALVAQSGPGCRVRFG